MTVSASSMIPAVCMRDPREVLGHWIDLSDLDPEVHTNAIIDGPSGSGVHSWGSPVMR